MTKNVISLCLAFILAVPLLAWTQATSQSSDQQNAQSQPSTQSQDGSQNQSDQNKHGKKQKMSGTVSDNGKTFTNDQNSKSYTVDNPSALQAQDGQHVSVIVGVDPDTGTLHIIQVAAPATPR